MIDDVEKLGEWLTPLLNKLSSTERRKLMQTVGREMRRRNQRRIRRQVDPDGQPFAPRLRGKRSRIRRAAMFTKLASAKYLRLTTTPNSAAIGWAGRVARIAEIHHAGLRDRVSKNGPMHTYAQRRLLGFSTDDHTALTDLIVTHLSKD